MPLGSAAQSALLKWVNTFADVGKEAKSIDELADGFVLGQVLHDLDPTYDTTELDEASGANSKWLTHKRNLQSVYKGLFKYIRHEAHDCVPLARVADFRAIAENPDADGLSQVISPIQKRSDLSAEPCDKILIRCATQFAAVLLATAALGSSDKDVRARAIKKVQNLDAVHQNAIRKILEEKQKQMKELAAKATEDEVLGDQDADLEHEANFSKLEAELKQKVNELEMETRRHADLKSRHAYLQENHDEVKAKLAEVEIELNDLRKLHGADESQRVQALQTKIDEQSRLIEQLEEDVESFKLTQQRLEVDLERYKASSEEGQEYKDKYDELHHQTQELERKANAADRYKQKLANNRNLEQEITNLKYELDARKDQEQKLQKAMLDCEKLQHTEKEMLIALARSEETVGHVLDQKDLLTRTNDDLKVQIEQLRHQNAVSERHIEDLKEQLTAVGEAPRSHSPSSETGEISNLERELQQTTNDFSKVKLLEAEIDILRQGAASSSQANDLRRELERIKAERDIAKSQYNSIFEKHGVAQEQIDALIGNMSGEWLVNGIEQALKSGPLGTLTSDYNRHVAYNSMREQLAQATRDIDELKHQYRKLEEQAKDKDREILSMRTDRALTEDLRYDLGVHEADHEDDFTVDAVGSDRLDALERLKQSDQLIAASLRSELESLREKYNSLEIENNMHKSQLLDALVAKEKLSKEKELEGPPANVAPEGVSQAELDDRMKDYKSKTDKLRDRVKLQKEASLRKLTKSFDPLATVISVRTEPCPGRTSWESLVTLPSDALQMTPRLGPIVEDEPSGQRSSVHGRAAENGKPSAVQTFVVVPPPQAATRRSLDSSSHQAVSDPRLLRCVTPPPEDLAWRQRNQKRKTRNWLSRFSKKPNQ
jgi:protein HOOK3